MLFLDALKKNESGHSSKKYQSIENTDLQTAMNTSDMKAAVLEDIRWYWPTRELRLVHGVLMDEIILAREHRIHQRRLAYDAWLDERRRLTAENLAADLAARMRHHEILLKAVADAKAEAEALAEARAKARALAEMGM